MATPSAIANRHLAVLTDIRDRAVRAEERAVGVEQKLDAILAALAAKADPTPALDPLPDPPPMPSPKNLGSTLTRKDR